MLMMADLQSFNNAFSKEVALLVTFCFYTPANDIDVTLLPSTGFPIH